jgi:hypothetical protein
MNYDPVGGLRVAGCAQVKASAVFFVKFNVGSKAYVKKKASRGKLEAVVIKKINRVGLTKPFRQGVGSEINYVDTTNRVWMEEELVSHQTAVDLSIIHWENVKQAGLEILHQNGCIPMPPEGCR